MQDRLISLFGATLSLLLVMMLLTPPSDPDARFLSLPTTEDRGDYGLLGLKTWLEHHHIQTLSLKSPYADLYDDEITQALDGNLLILSLPQTVAAAENDLAFLRDWLEVGNSALILSAHSDTPPWFSLSETGSGTALLAALGLALETQETATDDDAEENSAENQENLIALYPALPHPVTAGLERVETVSPATDRRDWRLSVADGAPGGLRLLVEKDKGYTGLWEIPLGEGRVWLSAYADVLGNISLGRADNAKLLDKMLHLALGRDGRVLFDDYHFGLGDLSDPDAFYRDPRLHHTLLFFGAFWLLYLLGYSNRLAPPQPVARRVHAVEFVEAGAGLFARRVSPLGVAQGLLFHFFNDLRRRYRAPLNGEPAWDVLKQHPGIAHRDLQRLRELTTRLEQGRAPDLPELCRLLHRIRNTLP